MSVMGDREIVLRVEHVSKHYYNGGASLRVLDDVDFEVCAGELVAIVGPSGCGKTTLLKVILGSERPDAGRVWLTPDYLNDSIATVQQSAALLPWRTLFQNACLGLEVRNRLDKTSTRFIEGLVDDYGLAAFKRALPGQLSGGMRQRVAVIRALGSRPKLLLCDEPFSSIDFVTRLQLSTQFRAMCRVRKITTIFVTHNIEEALFLGERVIVMSGRPGRIVAIRHPYFSIGEEDAVRCREAPEFWPQFHQIWNDLRGYHDGSP
jgi:NitT/TauT family transport system ATP-binding protein